MLNQRIRGLLFHYKFNYFAMGVFKTRNGEMTKWRNDEIAKWRNDEIAKWRNGTIDKSHSYKVLLFH